MTHLRTRLALALLAAWTALAVVPAVSRAAEIVVGRADGPQVVDVPAASEARTLSRLDAEPGVSYAAPNVTLHAASDADTYYGNEWALDNDGSQASGAVPDSDIDAPDAWAYTQGAGVTVAVVDQKVDVTHEDLAANIATGGASFVPAGHTCTGMRSDHGTHIAGIVAAVQNDKGIAGVAPQAKVLPVQALDDCGGGQLDWILNAFDYAGASGARVVVASFATDPGLDAATAQQLDAAFDTELAKWPKTLFVVAAGNEGSDDDTAPVYPCSASAANLLCVGDSTAGDAPYCGSNFGADSVDLFAPGRNIVSTYYGNYAYLSGTSQAAPMAAGVAALVDAMSPTLSGTDVAQRLRATVDPKVALTYMSVAGGRLNALRAVRPDLSVAAGGGDPAFACDSDDDHIPNAADRCQGVTGSTTAHGCPDADGDGIADAADACPDTFGVVTAAGCPDVDTDGVADSADDCPGTANAGQADADGDGVGDACDPTPRGEDVDGDGFPALDDACPTQPGTVNGCPAVSSPPPVATPAPTPVPTVTPVVPLRIVSVGVKVAHNHETARVSVRVSRTALTAVTVERRIKRGHRHVWARVTRRALAVSAAGRALTVRTRQRGSYRVTVTLSGARTVRRAFRV